MTKWRVVLVDVGGTGEVHRRVRRLYVARISNKLSADPLARSFIMTSTRARVNALSSMRMYSSACVRAYVRAADAFHAIFKPSMHTCARARKREGEREERRRERERSQTSTWRAKTMSLTT